MKMVRKESAKSRNEKRIEVASHYEQIILPKDEYAMVMSELNTHLSDDERKYRIITKPVGDYYYTVINNGFDDYIIIGKNPIDNVYDEEWELL